MVYGKLDNGLTRSNLFLPVSCQKNYGTDDVKLHVIGEIPTPIHTLYDEIN